MVRINYSLNHYCSLCEEKKPITMEYCDWCKRKLSTKVSNNKAKQKALANVKRY